MAYEVKHHPKSAAGDFYLEEEVCCLACGVPQVIAPELVGFEGLQCYWLKQPETSEELDKAIKILHTQELGCHRYGGSDPAILERLPPECCDVVSAPRPMRTISTWNLAGRPGVDFKLLSERNFFERTWRQIFGKRSHGVKQ